MIENIILGFGTALGANNLMFCFIGILLGTIIGIIPGLGPMATLSILLPITYSMSDPISAIIMMAGIYNGSQYGGSTTAILLRLPGEVSSAVSMQDGNAMAKQGLGGVALGVAGVGSFIAGCVATAFIMYMSPELINLSLLFGPKEYFALMVFGLICSATMTESTLLKSLISVLGGILLGLIGLDIDSGDKRYTFGTWNLVNGVPFLALCMGIFGLGEILHTYHKKGSLNIKPIKQVAIFTRKNILQILSTWKTMLRGSLIGSFAGIIPGGGSVLSAFMSYAVEKKISKDPKSFGRGNINGVAGPESANNAGAQTSFIPMLSLGLPVNPVMALMISTMIVHDIHPGPAVIQQSPELFWGLIASMWIGNLMLVILNLSTVNWFVKLLKIPFWIISVVVILSCVYGVYSQSNNIFDLYVLMFFGLLGFGMRIAKFELTPFMLGFVLGPKIEENLRQALQIHHGEITQLFSTGISITLYAMSMLLIIWSIYRKSN